VGDAEFHKERVAGFGGAGCAAVGYSPAWAGRTMSTRPWRKLPLRAAAAASAAAGSSNSARA